ncbi:hypothetical protein CYMTET_39121 [Cymbomonas tetramitiformis]|uniref:Uncharacterized protein n=1 Tax=Cymbomonas tetramitiformis TaxID=36881 RepID=A0AAE0F4L0_9CHLO|nr:hypothetical protein CYMTET_39121 [Cymbomonas tetramitiformis]
MIGVKGAAQPIAKRFKVVFTYDGDTHEKSLRFVQEYLAEEPPVDSEDELEAAPTSTAIVLCSQASVPPGDSQLGDQPDIRRTAHTGIRRPPRITRPVVVESISDDDMADDSGPEEEEAEGEGELAEAEGELLLGKYSVIWKEEGVVACQRQRDGWRDEDPAIRWDRVYAVQPSLKETKYLKYFCAFFPIPILEWWCRQVTKAGREKIIWSLFSQ